MVYSMRLSSICDAFEGLARSDRRRISQSARVKLDPEYLMKALTFGVPDDPEE